MVALVKVVGEDEWELWRDLRHRLLTTDPDALGASLEREQSYDEAAWRSRLAGGRAVVAWLDGVPVGMGASYEEEPGVHAVVSMWVVPEHRGRGIGRRVLEDVLAAVPVEARVLLWVADGHPARELYARAGFVETGERAPIRPGATSMKTRMELRRDR